MCIFILSLIAHYKVSTLHDGLVEYRCHREMWPPVILSSLGLEEDDSKRPLSEENLYTVCQRGEGGGTESLVEPVLNTVINFFKSFS